MTTTPAPTTALALGAELAKTQLLLEHAQRDLGAYRRAEHDHPILADLDRLMRERDAAREELAKTRAELDKAQQMEAMAGRHAQQRDADLKDAEVTIQRLKTRLAEADARWSRHMTDEHPIQSDGDCPARAEKGYAEELDKALQLLSEYIDDESCHIDHNGCCQEHGLSSTRRGGCRNVRAKQLLAANPATTAEPADEPKATCHLPVQNGEPCGLLTCRKHGCRVAPTAETAAS